MTNRRVDIGFGIASACAYGVALGVRFGTPDKGLWLVAGIIAGVVTWVLIRYAAFRVLVKGGQQRPVGIMLVLCLDFFCIPASGVLGAVLLRGYSPGTTWQVLSESAPTWWPVMAIGGALAIAGVSAAAARESRRKRAPGG
ncbi:MAG: hypothetical protein ACOC1F_04090 [Myxococcota bacterium]